MNLPKTIAKKTAGILTFVNDNVRADENMQDDIFQALYMVHKLFPQCTIVSCPVTHTDFFYISENSKSLFGYDATHMMVTHSILEKYLAELHESDIQDFHECINYIGSFFKEECLEDLHKFRCIFYYRFRHATGRYIYMQDQKATLVTANNRIIHYSLLREMDRDSIFSGVKVEIYRERPVFEKIAEYKPSHVKNKLSPREADLVDLIKRGLTTKEIAWQLNISHNTVRNIKSKMFEKYNVTNAIELLNMAG